MELREFFARHPRCALAFSGGADSAYLLFAGLSSGAEIRPYYAKTAFQPAFELRDAQRLCRQLKAPLRVLEPDVLACETVRRNDAERCYHCKSNIMSTILRAAEADGFPLLLDGTNASDDGADRPGMRALEELGIVSPLRLCGLTKPEIRRLSREAGLFTWDKPAYACLATRIRTGEEITAARLRAVEESEEILFSLGFTDFRVRSSGERALLQFPEAQLPRAEAAFPEIRERLSPYFAFVTIDPRGRETSL